MPEKYRKGLPPPSPPPTQAELKQINDAKIEACQNAVLAGLKAPGTAHFVSALIGRSGDKWAVVGDVDSHNSYGAATARWCAARRVAK